MPSDLVALTLAQVATVVAIIGGVLGIVFVIIQIRANLREERDLAKAALDTRVLLWFSRNPIGRGVTVEHLANELSIPLSEMVDATERLIASGKIQQSKTGPYLQMR